MDSYYLSEKADNRYKNKEARIIVNLESIQAESGENESNMGEKMRRILELPISHVLAKFVYQCDFLTKKS